MGNILGVNITKSKFSLINENYDYYLGTRINNITEAERSRVPDDLAHKVFKGAKYALPRLSTDEKRYLLFEVFRCISVEVVLDEQGMNLVDFTEVLQTAVKRKQNKQTASLVHQAGLFVLGNRTLMRSLEFLELVCASDIYKLADEYRAEAKISTAKAMKAEKVKTALEGVARLLMSYDGQIRKLAEDNVLKRADMYCLFYLFTGGKTRDGLTTRYPYSYGGNKHDMKMAFTRLKDRNLIMSKAAHSRYAEYYLTATGENLMTSILKGVLERY